MCLIRLFSIKELEALDEKQLAILADAIRLEIRSSDEITKILRKNLKKELYDPWVKQKPKPATPARGKKK